MKTHKSTQDKILTNEELLAFKELHKKTELFSENEPSLAGVPWDEIPKKTKERIACNGKFFDTAYVLAPQLIDELLAYRQNGSRETGI